MRFIVLWDFLKGDTMFSLRDVIEIAIQIEKNGEKVYRRALEKASDLSLASLLQHLADEEGRHIQWFSELAKEAETSVDDPRVEKAGRLLLQSILGNQSFSLGDTDLSSMEGIEALLTTAMEFEKDTALFYEMMRSFVQDQDVSGQLDAIIKEEYQHVRNLEKFLDDTQGMGKKALPPKAGGDS
jgi:rubrerythrin